MPVDMTPVPRATTRRFRKTLTFANVAGQGAQGTVLVATLTGGSVLIEQLTAVCTTDLAGASATVEMGVAGGTALLIAQTTATDIDAGEVWGAASPAAPAGNAITSKVVNGNIIITVGTSNLTGGVLDIEIFYKSIRGGGLLT